MTAGDTFGDRPRPFSPWRLRPMPMAVLGIWAAWYLKLQPGTSSKREVNTNPTNLISAHVMSTTEPSSYIRAQKANIIE